MQQGNQLIHPFQTAGEQIDRPMVLQAQQKIGAMGHNGLHPGNLPGPWGDAGLMAREERVRWVSQMP